MFSCSFVSKRSDRSVKKTKKRADYRKIFCCSTQPTKTKPPNKFEATLSSRLNLVISGEYKSVEFNILTAFWIGICISSSSSHFFCTSFNKLRIFKKQKFFYKKLTQFYSPMYFGHRSIHRRIITTKRWTPMGKRCNRYNLWRREKRTSLKIQMRINLSETCVTFSKNFYRPTNFGTCVTDFFFFLEECQKHIRRTDKWIFWIVSVRRILFYVNELSRTVTKTKREMTS